MIYNDIKPELHSTIQTSQMGIKTGGKAFDLLISKLYAYPLLSTIREISSNAKDAMGDNGKADQPFHITLPSKLNDNVFTIRDFGKGLSVDDVNRYLNTLFESSKDQSNDAIGCMGLGSKSPFSICSSYDIISYHNGMKHSFVFMRHGNGAPELVYGGSVPMADGEETGIQFNIPMPNYDIEEVKDAVNLALFAFRPLPVITNLDSGDIWSKPIFESPNGMVFSCPKIRRHYGYSAVSMGDVVYKGNNLGASVYVSSSICCISKLNIGDIPLPPSRETTLDDAPSKAIFNNKSSALNEDVINYIIYDTIDGTVTYDYRSLMSVFNKIKERASMFGISHTLAKKNKTLLKFKDDEACELFGLNNIDTLTVENMFDVCGRVADIDLLATVLPFETEHRFDWHYSNNLDAMESNIKKGIDTISKHKHISDFKIISKELTTLDKSGVHAKIKASYKLNSSFVCKVGISGSISNGKVKTLHRVFRLDTIEFGNISSITKIVYCVDSKNAVWNSQDVASELRSIGSYSVGYSKACDKEARPVIKMLKDVCDDIYSGSNSASSLRGYYTEMFEKIHIMTFPSQESLEHFKKFINLFIKIKGMQPIEFVDAETEIAKIKQRKLEARRLTKATAKTTGKALNPDMVKGWLVHHDFETKSYIRCISNVCSSTISSQYNNRFKVFTDLKIIDENALCVYNRDGKFYLDKECTMFVPQNVVTYIYSIIAPNKKYHLFAVKETTYKRYLDNGNAPIKPLLDELKDILAGLNDSVRNNTSEMFKLLTLTAYMNGGISKGMSRINDMIVLSMKDDNSAKLRKLISDVLGVDFITDIDIDSKTSIEHSSAIDYAASFFGHLHYKRVDAVDYILFKNVLQANLFNISSRTSIVDKFSDGVSSVFSKLFDRKELTGLVESGIKFWEDKFSEAFRNDMELLVWAFTVFDDSMGRDAIRELTKDIYSTTFSVYDDVPKNERYYRVLRGFVVEKLKSL